MSAALSRPLGVTLIAFYTALGALSILPVGCLAAFATGVEPSFAMAGTLMTALGIAHAAATYGLWTMQPWARGFAWWLYFCSIPIAIAFLTTLIPGVDPSDGDKLMTLITMAIAIVILVYLRCTPVVCLFSTNSPRQSEALQKAER